ncbi:4Fe-4S dicluster domain-containing protein [Thermodesulfobacteriota bacterium]
MAVPKVDEAKCEGNASCIEVCPADVFEMQGGKSVVVRPDDCVECMACVENCPTQAIEVI